MDILLEVVNTDDVVTRKRINLADELLGYAQEQLCASEKIRSARIYKEIFYTHKSFAEDFNLSLENFPQCLEGNEITEGDFQIFDKIRPSPFKDAITFDFYDSHTLEGRIRSLQDSLVGSNGDISIGEVELLLEDLSVLLERSHRLESLEK